MRNILIALMVLPAVALAQGPNKSPPPPGQPDQARDEKRMRMVRTIGLAELLDLDTAQALKLGDTLSKFDERRAAIRKQAMEASDLLRNAAHGNGKATAAEVDGAISKLLDARAQLQSVDREMLQAITKDLSPQQKARAALFLSRFRQRIERRMWTRPAMGGRGGPGMPGRPGMMRDHDRHGMRMGPWDQDDHLVRGPAGDDETGFDPPPFADEDID
jgi:hypothetical protein